MKKTQEKEESKSISSSIWKDLPSEVLEIVLACLPTHVLCRFRLVCKEWNHLISQPSFATLRALSPCKSSLIFVSPKLVTLTTSSQWQVLDLTEKRSYKLSNSFITDYFYYKNRELENPWWPLKYTLAAAGELIYIVYKASPFSKTGMHIVCNPISKSFHEIPGLPGIYNHKIVVMSVDNATKTYKIVSIGMPDEPGSQTLFLYESTTSVWRNLCEVPRATLFAYSSIFMEGILYTLFVDFSSFSFQSHLYTIVLYSCDVVTSAWCKMDVHFSLLSTTKDYPQLVVSSGGLYMVRSTRWARHMVKLSIWKIVLETKEVVEVAPEIHLSKISRMPIAVGCANSIIILSKEGSCMKFDLLQKSWQMLSCDILDKRMNSNTSGMYAYLVDF